MNDDIARIIGTAAMAALIKNGYEIRQRLFKSGEKVRSRISDPDGLDTEMVYTVRYDESGNGYVYLDVDAGNAIWPRSYFYRVSDS